MLSVRRIRPDIDADPVFIGEGISTLAYALTSPDGDWVLRVSRVHPEPWTWRGGRAYEVDLLTELRQRGVPVATDAAVIQEVGGLPAAILERRVVGAPVHPDQVRDDPRLITSFAQVLDLMHSVEPDDVVLRGVPREDPTTEFRQALDALDLAEDDLLEQVEASIALLEGRRSLRLLCHRDFRLGHLLVDDSRELVGLLDLGEVGIDDPAIDLAFLHGELGPQIVSDICAAMGTADPGLGEAARAFHDLWPLLELGPGGELWGDPATARGRLEKALDPRG